MQEKRESLSNSNNLVIVFSKTMFNYPLTSEVYIKIDLKLIALKCLLKSKVKTFRDY